MRQRGAIFCHVVRIMQVNHGRPLITCGSHQCIGAAPSFKKRLIIMMIFMINGLTKDCW